MRASACERQVVCVCVCVCGAFAAYLYYLFYYLLLSVYLEYSLHEAKTCVRGERETRRGV
jgi:hypothetical protein